MKRTALVLGLAVLVTVSAGTLIVEALANPSSYVRLFDNVVIRVQSPQNRNYAERNIPLNFTVETNNEEQLKTRYVLNNGNPVEVTTPVVSTRTETGWYGDGSAERNYTFNYPRYTAQGNAALLNLSDGTYDLTIQRYFPDPMEPKGVRIINATTVRFTVGAPSPGSSIARLPTEELAIPILSMPVEYVNYTITSLNGALWAKIDGTYPVQILNIGSSYLQMDSLPMVYPTPPGTTNINVTLNEKPLDWNNYTELYPTALHHTAIGEWPMINCTIKPVTGNFTLKIHYEHPLPMVNGSYLFLYDLNIASYLSPQSPISTAYFKIYTNLSISNLKAYTTETDTVWNPVGYTISQEGTMQVFSVQIQSEYSKPLMGDLVVTLNGEGNPEFPSWVTPTLLIATAAGTCLSLLVYWKKRKR